MEKFYTNERNIQMLIFMLKKHGIRKVIVSPGATNVTFVGSIQHDSFFEIYSCVDERSAAYMACGLAFAAQEPVVLSCTGATASRNYIPALTEAFYRKLPILAVTSTQSVSRVGNMFPQVIDRSQQLKDMVIMSQHVQTIKDSSDEHDVNLKLNKAILELQHRGGGPVHINMETKYSKDFSVKEILPTRIIARVNVKSKFPVLPNKRIGIFVGAHCPFSEEETIAIDRFCEAHNSAVFVDHTSNYSGKYKVLYSVAKDQRLSCPVDTLPSLVIHIGEITGDYSNVAHKADEVWRVCEDGNIQDAFGSLTNVFEMAIIDFFEKYTPADYVAQTSYFEKCKNELISVRQCLPILPLSNAWIAQQTTPRIPNGSFVYLSILNTLRNWNFFEMDPSITCISNTGGFGIDGILSSLIGSSFSDESKLFFAIIGDLAFFYDINALGNRHIGNNVRILLINNGRGVEFRNYDHPAQAFEDEADEFMAAARHFGNKSANLVKHFATDLGFDYLCANSKEEYLEKVDKFVSFNSKPILFEVFTDVKDESNALKMIRNCRVTTQGRLKAGIKEFVGNDRVNLLKKILNG